MRQWLAITVAVGMLSAWPAAAHADAMIEGAKLCTQHLPRYERQYGIPSQLLSAIAATESGRYHKGLGLSIPWPWTINAAGKGYYYDSKSEAVAAARSFQRRGVRSIDVGCMQVNLYHHSNAFASLEEAFDPQKNVAYAAGFLRNLYEATRSWKEASADYHSKTTKRGKEYAGRVYNSWYTIIDKLRAARMQVAGPSYENAPAEVRVASAEPKVVKPLPEQMGRKVAAHAAPRMNSITVSKQPSVRERGIIVVRPEIKVVDEPATTVTVTPAAQTLTVAEAASELAVQPAAAKVIRVDGASGKKPGPNFVFSN